MKIIFENVINAFLVETFNDNYEVSIALIIDNLLISLGYIVLLIWFSYWIEEIFLKKKKDIFLSLLLLFNSMLFILFFILASIYCFVFFNNFVLVEGDSVSQNHILLLPLVGLLLIKIFYKEFPSFVEKVTKYRIKFWLPFFILVLIKFLLRIDLGTYSQASFIIYNYDFIEEIAWDFDLAIYFAFALFWKYFDSFSIWGQMCFFFLSYYL